MAEKKSTIDNVVGIAKLGLYFILIKKGLEIFQVIDTQEEREQAAAAAALEEGREKPTSSGQTLITTLPNNPSLATNPNYFITIYKYYVLKYPNIPFGMKKQATIPTNTLQQLARNIYNAKGKYITFYNDNELALYSSFRLCETQYQVSLMSFYFTYYYKQDMYTYIKSWTNTEERAEIYNIIKDYPQVYKYW